MLLHGTGDNGRQMTVWAINSMILTDAVSNIVGFPAPLAWAKKKWADGVR